MVAVAAAFSASGAAVNANDEMFRATQAARVSLGQLLSEVRRADSVLVSTTQIDVIRPSQQRLANETTRRFSYNATAKKLSMTINYVGGTSATYEMAQNVSACTFGPAVTGVNSVGQAAITRVPIALEVTVGSNTVRVNGAAAPRRAQQ